jgi:hypothetical protein
MYLMKTIIHYTSTLPVRRYGYSAENQTCHSKTQILSSRNPSEISIIHRDETVAEVYTYITEINNKLTELAKSAILSHNYMQWGNS